MLKRRNKNKAVKVKREKNVHKMNILDLNGQINPENATYVAAMDLGTNSNRLLVGDEFGNPVYRDVKHVALGEGLAENGVFSEEAVNRALNSFTEFAKILKTFKIKKYRAIATAACRMNKHAADFIRKIKDETDVDVEIISEFEEARLTLKGAKLNAPDDKDYLIVYDLGGGSTEVTLATNDKEPKILATVSIPLGARNATEMFSLVNYNKKGEKLLVAEVKHYMEEFFQKIEGIDYKGKTALIATSSTPLRLASWCFGHPKYDMFAVDGLTIPIKRIEALINKTLRMPLEARTESVYIGKSRARIFVAACIIFRTIYRALEMSEMTASLKSAQEAIVRELCDEEEMAVNG